MHAMRGMGDVGICITPNSRCTSHNLMAMAEARSGKPSAGTFCAGVNNVSAVDEAESTVARCARMRAFIKGGVVYPP